jgi:hypothetical protein
MRVDVFERRHRPAASANLDHAQFSRAFALYFRNSSYLANRGERLLVRQKVESAGKTAQYGLVRGPAAMFATCQMADFKRDFPSRMAINMHNEPLRLFWIT